jgi:hypothetical protein
MGRVIFAVVVAAAAGLLAEAAFDETRSDAATGPATIRVTTREVRYHRVDLGPRRRSPGDMEIVTALLYNRRITPRPIGHLELACTFMVGPSRTCQGSIFLPKGKLVIGGPIYVRSFYQVAVLGGTGLYDNARGFMTGTRISRSPRSELLLVQLVG